MAGALLTWLWPLPFAFPAAVPIGSTMVFASILLFLFSVRALRAAGTPVLGIALWISRHCQLVEQLVPLSHLMTCSRHEHTAIPQPL
jgi:hypothetical protein